MVLPPLATQDDAESFGYVLPSDTAVAWLARASVRVRRAAGQSINSTQSTVRFAVDGGEILMPGPPITAVASVAAVNPDMTTTALVQGVDWMWDGGEGLTLLHRCRTADVVYTHGFIALPDELVELVCSVAVRLSNTPVGMEAGIRSVTIDDYSRTFAAEARVDASCLLPGEQDALNDILAVPSVHVVRSR